MDSYMLLSVHKVRVLPEVPQPNSIYFVKHPDTGRVNAYVSDKTGTSYTKIRGGNTAYYPSVRGPIFTEAGKSRLYRISDYDGFTDYSVSAEHGKVSIVERYIVYTTPRYSCLGGFTVNGRKIKVRVVDSLAKGKLLKDRSVKIPNPVTYFMSLNRKRRTP